MRFLIILTAFSSFALYANVSKPTGVHQSNPFPQIDAIVQQAISSHQIPGAVVLVGHDGQVIYRKAFGWRSLEPRVEPMTTDTIFDVASLTKVIATTTCVMRLVQLGQVSLSDPVGHYIPEFVANGKQDITVKDLLIHYSGLAPDIDLNKFPNDYRAALQVAFDEKPLIPPDTGFIYSDTNFIVLGALVERISGMTLDEYAAAHIFQPLRMSHSRFVPPASWRPNIAPTEYDEHGVMLRGVVHDPRARLMGGIAGHAGLFSTADDLAKFAQALLDGDKILSGQTIKLMSTPQQPPTATAVRGLGWDIDSPLSSNRGELLPVGSFGHTGWTGTSLWVDPITRSYIIILSNSVHPDGKGNAVALRSKIATTVAAYLPLTPSEEKSVRLHSITGYNEANPTTRRVSVRMDNVKVGLDVLESGSFNLDIFRSGKTKRIGILTSLANGDSEANRTIDVLSHAPGVALTAIFAVRNENRIRLDNSPHHDEQTFNTSAPTFAVNCGTDSPDRLSKDDLKDLDALIVNIQDSGTSKNSCVSVLGHFLESAAHAGIDVVVLDRPNPITGSIVEGPLTNVGLLSAAGSDYSIPIRHGMTIGELAQLFNTELHIGAKLTVIPMQGWTRSDWFDSTSLAWSNPSSDIHNLTEAVLYAGVALLESSNASIGRGTGTPFQLVGAPWVDARQFAAYLNARHIEGVRFVPTRFTPDSGRYAAQECSGVNIVVINRDVLDVPELGLELLSAFRQLYPKQFETQQNLMPSEMLLGMGGSAARVASDWQASIDQFDQTRKKYLLYK